MCKGVSPIAELSGIRWANQQVASATVSLPERCTPDMTFEMPESPETREVQQITFFAPDRPVEGGTLFVRPLQDDADESD